MNVLITGGAGFVGRHITKRFLKLGHDVTVVDNFYPGSGCIQLNDWPEHLKPSAGQNLIVVQQDCREFFKENLESADKFDVVVHLAAIVGGRMVIEHQPLAVGVDLSIDAEFFYWLSKIDYKPHRIHYFSSSAAYPIHYQRKEESKILTEDMINFNGGFIGEPDLTYGWTKLTGEFLAKLAHQKHGHYITCYRPFSGYGEDQDLSYPFPAILQRAMRKENPMTVWGSGQQSRDFIYIEDCIDGMLTVSEKIGDGSGVNLSTGIATTFNELARLCYVVANGSDDNLTIQNTASKPEGVFARVGSTKFQQELGFQYKTSLKEGIEISYSYMKNN